MTPPIIYEKIKLLFFSFLWFGVLTIPSLMMILVGQTSFTVGIIIVTIVCSVFIIVFSNHCVPIKYLYIVFVIIFFIVVHTVIVKALYGYDIEINRLVGGTVALLSQLVFAIGLSKIVLDMPYSRFLTATRYVFILLIVNGILLLTGIDFFNTGLAKPSFLFQEPSHYAIVISPFLFFYSYFYRNEKRTLVFSILIFFLVIALHIKNMTLLISVLVAYLFFSKLKLGYLFCFYMVILIASYMYFQEDFQYFTDRLNISSESDNLSVLVFYQGWENALLTLFKTSYSFFGGGFQQFGVTTEVGKASNIIYSISGAYLNRYDAGAIAPKLIGEFGVFGAAIVLFHLYFICCQFISLKKGKYENDSKMAFSVGVVISSFIEFYVRGSGYFTPTVTMLFCCLFYLNFRRIK